MLYARLQIGKLSGRPQNKYGRISCWHTTVALVHLFVDATN